MYDNDCNYNFFRFFGVFFTKLPSTLLLIWFPIYTLCYILIVNLCGNEILEYNFFNNIFTLGLILGNLLRMPINLSKHYSNHCIRVFRDLTLLGKIGLGILLFLLLCGISLIYSLLIIVCIFILFVWEL